MAHSGSALSASSKDFCEARYQNECWYSIAWSKCCCASGLQDVSKWTLPRSFAGAAKADGANISAIATMAIVVRLILIIIGPLNGDHACRVWTPHRKQPSADGRLPIVATSSV